MTVEALSQWLPVLGLCMLRPLGVMIMVPLFNGSTLGGSLIRNALALVITLPLVAIAETWPQLEAARQQADIPTYMLL
ncbi:hypothetical protein ACOI9Y_32795, partial [Mesorhizobium japonicum]